MDCGLTVFAIRWIYTLDSALLECWVCSAEGHPLADFTLHSADPVAIHIMADRLYSDGPYADGGSWFTVPISYTAEPERGME